MLLGYHWLLFRRTLRGVLISRFLLPVLFLASMGLGVGSLVDSASGGVDGIPYLLYVVPGLVMVTAMQTAVNESTWPVMGFVKWNQFYRAMLNAPHSVGDTLRAHWLMIAFNVATSALAFTIIAALFGGVRSWWSLLGVPIAVLTGMAFSTPLFIIAAKADNDSIYSAVFRLVVTPLMLFSGAFFPIEQLPVWMQPVAWATPLWHGIELGRAAFLGGPVPGLWWVHMGVLGAYIIVGAVIARRAMQQRMVP
ncbi:MAG: ABC transporter permease [Intrasporangiaceae bacterium]|nr:ABC transporter permease [Intrasporangiaceae bacterium]